MKRSISLLLSVLMIFCFIPFNSFAAGTDGAKESVTTEAGSGTSSDIKYGTYESGKNWVENSKVKNATLTYDMGEGNQLDLTKEAVPTEDPNVYNVTLKTKATVKTKINTVPSDAALALIIDNSTSMTQNNSTKLANAKKAAIELLKAYAIVEKRSGIVPYEEPTVEADRWVCVVTFNQTASVAQEWINVRTSKNYNAVVQAINGITSKIYTNIDDGILLATKQLTDIQQDKTKPTINKENSNAVLLTDGKPTHYVSKDKYGRKTTPSVDSNQRAAFETTNEDAGDLRDKVNSLYAVGLETGNETTYVYENNRGKNVSVNEYLKKYIASKDCFIAADEAGKLVDIFKEISKQIESQIETHPEVITVDPETSVVKIISVSDHDGEFKETKSGSGIYNWIVEKFGDIKDSKHCTVYENGDGSHTYVFNYSVTYQVRINADDENFDEDKYYPLNGETYITIKDKKYQYPVPAVHGKKIRFDITFKAGSYGKLNGQSGDVVYKDLKKGVQIPAAPEVTADADHYFIGFTDQNGKAYDPAAKVTGDAVYTAQYMNKTEITLVAGSATRMYTGNTETVNTFAKISSGETEGDITGSDPTIAIGLDEYTLKGYSVNTSKSSIGEYEVPVIIGDKAKVLNSKGEDVSYKFNISTVSGKLIIQEGSMSVTGTNVDTSYNGNNHFVSADPSVTEGTTVKYTVKKDGKTLYENADAEEIECIDVGVYDIYAVATNANYGEAKTNYTITVRQAPVTLKTESEEITYGEPIKFPECKIMGNIYNSELGEIKVQYYKVVDGKEVPFTGDDFLPGEYYKRISYSDNQNYAVSKDEGKLTVKPSDVLTVKLTEDGKDIGGVYTGKEYSSPAKAYINGKPAAAEDGVTIEYRYSNDGGKTWSDWSADVPSRKDVGITNVEARANKPGYIEATASCDIEVTPATLTIKGVDVTQEYGKALPEWSYRIDGIVDADAEKADRIEEDLNIEVSCDCGDMPDVREDGYPIVPSRGEGSICDPNYITAVENGIFNVIPREGVTVWIEGHNDTQIYNGKEHEVEGYDIESSKTEGDLAPDGKTHLYDETYVKYSNSYKDARITATYEGYYPMGLKAEDFKNTDPNFTDVKFEVTDGWLEIKPCENNFKITSGSETFDYDGKKHTNSEVSISEDFEKLLKANGDELRAKPAGEVINVSQDPVKNVFEFCDIIHIEADGSQHNVNNCYIFDIVEGDLTVNPKKVTISGLVDGKKEAEVMYGEKAVPAAEYSLSDKLVSADDLGTISADYYNAKDEKAVPASGELSVGTYTVKPAYTENSNYDVSAVNGILKVNPSDKLTVAIDAEGKDVGGVYKGEAYSYPAAAYVDGVPAVEADKVKIEYRYSEDGGKTWSDWSEKVPSRKDVGVLNVEVRANKENYEQATTEYNIVVTPAELKVTAVDQEIVYGQSRDAFKSKVEGFVGEDQAEEKKIELIDDLNIEYNCDCGINPVTGEYDIVPSGETNIGNYDVVYVDGKFTVNKITDKVIVVKAASNDTFVYDGTAKSDKNWTTYVKDAEGKIIEGKTAADVLVNGDSLAVVITGEIKEAGSAANTVGSANVTRGAQKVTDCYTIETEEGLLEMSKRPVKIVIDPQSMVYGGEEPVFTGHIENMPEGHESELDPVTYERKNKSTEAGKYEITASYKSNKNYEVTVEPNYLTIYNNKELAVMPEDASFVFDNAEHTKTAQATIMTKDTELSYVTYDGDIDDILDENGNIDQAKAAEWAKKLDDDKWNEKPDTIKDAGSILIVARARLDNYDDAYGAYYCTVIPKQIIIICPSFEMDYGNSVPDEFDEAPIVIEPAKDDKSLDNIKTILDPSVSVSDADTYKGAMICDFDPDKNPNYDAVIQKGDFKVNKSELMALNVSNSGCDVDYDGKPHGQAAVVKVNDSTEGVPEDVKVIYSYINEEGQPYIGEEYPVLTNAGTIDVHVEASHKNYKTATADYTLKVNKVKISFIVNNGSKNFGSADPDFNKTEGAYIKNFDTEIAKLVNRNDIGTVSVKRTNADVNDCGNYNNVLVVEYSRNPNYDVTYTAGDFEIVKKAPLKIDVSACGYEGTYDAASHTGGLPKVKYEDGAADDENTTVWYKVGKDGKWTTKQPSIKDVGIQTIYVKATNPKYADPADENEYFYTNKVTHAEVNVTPKSTTKELNTPDPEINLIYDGLKGSDADNPEKYIKCNVSRDPGEEVRDYKIYVTGDEYQNNYRIRYNEGLFTIATMVLDNQNHYAYVIGYEGKVVKPNNAITRAEAATMFVRLLDEKSRDDARRGAREYAEKHPFSDVKNPKAWYYNAIYILASKGILTGYGDGSFLPDATITRAEFAAIACRFFNPKSGKTDLIDIEGHWAKEYIEAAYCKGWITGYSDNTFKPNNRITRAEAINIINNMLHRLVDKSLKVYVDEGELINIEDMFISPEVAKYIMSKWNEWKDNRPGMWHYVAVQEATNAHEYSVVEGSDDPRDTTEKWTGLRENYDWELLQTSEWFNG